MIDGDMRHASLSNYTDSYEIGLSNYLAEETNSISEITIADKTYPNLHIIPTGTIPPNPTELLESDRFAKLLKEAEGKYRYIFIDCPPSLDLLTLNGLCAADTVLIPLQCEFFALEGLSELMSTVRNTKSMYNPYLDIEGLLLTMYDGRLNLTQQVVEEVKKYFPHKAIPIARVISKG